MIRRTARRPLVSEETNEFIIILRWEPHCKIAHRTVDLNLSAAKKTIMTQKEANPTAKLWRLQQRAGRPVTGTIDFRTAARLAGAAWADLGKVPDWIHGGIFQWTAAADVSWTLSGKPNDLLVYVKRWIIISSRTWCLNEAKKDRSSGVKSPFELLSVDQSLTEFFPPTGSAQWNPLAKA